MVFFPQSSSDPQVDQWIRTLSEALKAKDKLRLGPSRGNWKKTWSRAFTSLKKKHGVDKVSTVLAWYCDNCGKEFIPQANSAPSFQTKFDAIVRAMDNSGDNPGEDVSEWSIRTAEALANRLVWPVEIKSHLEVIVERSKKRWEKFCKVMENYGPTNAANRSHFFINYIITHHAPVFVENWCEFLASKYGHIQGLNTSPLSLAWKPESKWFFESFWRKWADDWCGSPRTFDGLLKVLISGEEKE